MKELLSVIWDYEGSRRCIFKISEIKYYRRFLLLLIVTIATDVRFGLLLWLHAIETTSQSIDLTGTTILKNTV